MSGVHRRPSSWRSASGRLRCAHDDVPASLSAVPRRVVCSPRTPHGRLPGVRDRCLRSGPGATPSPVPSAVPSIRRVRHPSVSTCRRAPCASVSRAEHRPAGHLVRPAHPGSTPGYPACDVALRWPRFGMPGEPGTTWYPGACPSGHVPAAAADLERDERARAHRPPCRGPAARRTAAHVSHVPCRHARSHADVSIARKGRRGNEQRLVSRRAPARATSRSCRWRHVSSRPP